MSALADNFLCAIKMQATNDTSFGEYLELLPDWLWTLEYSPWMGAIFGSILVGLTGVLPLLFIPLHQTDVLKEGENASRLKVLLSFAVGGLLGDVFLHSLPEIFSIDYSKSEEGSVASSSGVLILAGLIGFVVAEKVFSSIPQFGKNEEKDKTVENNNTKGVEENIYKRQITGYLNLASNTLDNFTHGLSLGGAFLVSLKLGVLTTSAILIHEIPHEVGDFAILLNSGFTRWHAGLFQLLTAGGGLVGALSAIFFSGATNSIEARTSWILPFTTGSFLHIALVTVLPDILKEDDPKESIKQLFALIFGILIMACVSNII